MKKLLLLLLFIPLVNCSDGEEILDNVPESNDDTNPVYLDNNGVTIKAKDWSVIGDSGVINGVTYTIVSSETLYNMVDAGADLTSVCTSKVTSMENMFYGASSFNQPIGGWDVSNVTRMSNMFYGASSFNQPLNNWDVSNSSYVDNMFQESSSFNQPLNNWDTSNFTHLQNMFEGAINSTRNSCF